MYMYVLMRDVQVCLRTIMTCLDAEKYGFRGSMAEIASCSYQARNVSTVGVIRTGSILLLFLSC